MEYSVFDRLCKERKIRPADVSKETGISKSTFSAWKSGTYIPKLDKIKKIADYFNISLDYLTGKTDDAFVKIEGNPNYVFNAATGTFIPSKENQDPAAVDFLRNQNVVKLSDEAISIAERYSASAPEVQEMIRMLLKYSEHQS